MRQLRVRINSGEIIGGASEGVAYWKGVPFAAPPVGVLRWRAPQKPVPWSNVLDATTYAPDPMQIPVATDAAPLGTTPQEDCLYANIWRADTAEDGLPVLVWIYGGGFVNGGSSPPTYSGEAIAREGVVFVSFNYRLGRFGTFGHSALTKEDADNGLLGNYGILDQIAALRWVQDNIAAFGGNPSRVTVMGESAGGISLHLLAASPQSRGLYQGAIIMSGAAGERPGSASLPEIEILGETFANQLGIEPRAEGALERLRALPADAIAGDLNMTNMFTHRPLTWVGPFVDGKIVEDPSAAYESGRHNCVPMIIGATADDIEGRTGFMVGGARRISTKLAALGVPIYQYRFSYVPEALSRSDPTLGALHATDIPFFLNTQRVKYGDETTSRDYRIGGLISRYIVQFVKTGDPNSTGMPEWPVYSGPNAEIMDFSADGNALAMVDPWGAEIDASQGSQIPDLISLIRTDN